MSELPFRIRTKRNLIRAGRLASRVMGRDNTVYVDQRVLEYRSYWSGAAARLSATFEDLADDMWEVTLGRHRTRIVNYMTEADDPVTLHLAGDKPYCIQLAKNVRLPVAAIGVYDIDEWDEILGVLNRAEDPLVVKPAYGSSSGLGITTHVQSRRELERATLLASLYDPRILIERFVPGESCRLLFLNGEMIHGVRRRGLRVTGDNASPIKQLLRRDGAPDLTRDATTRITLAAQGLTFDTVIPDGQSVVIRNLPLGESKRRELRTVYNETITDKVGPALRDEVGRLVRELRCQFVGVDLVTNDPAVSLAQSGGVFLEVNTTPGIHHHYHTREEKEQHPVATKVLEYLLQAQTQDAENEVGVAAYDYNRPRGDIRG